MSKGWSSTRLGDVAGAVERAQAPVPGMMYRQIGVKLWGQGAYEREVLDGGATKYARLFRAEAGDIIVNKIWARSGSVAVVPEALAGCYGSGEFPMFAPNRERLDSRWMRWLTKTPAFWNQCDEKSQGTSGKNRIRPEKFLTIEIPLPPLEEQQLIVARIEELSAEIQRACNLRQQAAKEADALWQRSAEQIFIKLAETESNHRLAELITIRGGGTPSKADPLYWDGKIPWITPKDMKTRKIKDSIDHISEHAAKESAAKVIAPGAVLVVVRGMILAHTFPSAVLLTHAAINQDMKALVSNGQVMPEFLCSMFWAINQEILGQVEKSTHDTRKFETNKLLSTRVPLPSFRKQQRIVAELDELQEEVDTLRRHQAETAAELDALLSAILDRAFKGQL